jgi:ABC-type sugar transport system ATPase subunit
VAEVTFDLVSKRFGTVDALVDFSLEIADREFLVLVGPSGSGKTTALRLLGGLEEMSSGTIRIGDRVVNRVSPGSRDIAMVFQNYALYPHMTVYQNLAYSLKMRKYAKAEVSRRVAAAAEMLGIADLLKRKPAQLSGGQRQRVALGRALVREPQVFLMDEPLSNLDAQLRIQTRGEIKRLQQRVGTTTVYVTHDQVEAMTMGDRIVVMNAGRVEQIGRPDFVYDSPANQFVAGFIGSPPMTFGRFSQLAGGAGMAHLKNGTTELQIPYPMPLPEDVVVGIRPEDTRIWRENASLIGPLKGRAHFVESLGRETFVGVEVSDGAKFIVYVEGRFAVGLGDTVEFGLLQDRLYFFDAVSGQAMGRT